MVKKTEPDASLDIWLLCAMWTHATPHIQHVLCHCPVVIEGVPHC